MDAVEPAHPPMPHRLPVAILGSLLAVAGVVLTLRPFTSLSVLVLVVASVLVVSGTVEFLVGRTAGSIGRTVVGAVWVVAGIAIFARPEIGVRSLAVAVGVAMLLAGVRHLLAAVRSDTPHRVTAVVEGVADVLFGVLALLWPDVTLLVVSIVFGVRTMLFGLRLLRGALGRSASSTGVPATTPHSFGRQHRHRFAAPAALIAALALTGLSVLLHRSTGEIDGFYDPPSDLPSEPGRLVRFEPFDRGVPEHASARRILYTTTHADGSPAVASALVVTPHSSPSPSPLVTWAHGTTGVARGCAPTVMRAGLEAGAFYLIDDVLDEGWTLLAPDYIGLGTEGPHPYLVGETTGRTVLDAIRAVRAFDGVELGEDTVVWGHSQGGGAALWTGVEAARYAPELQLAGIAALAPAADVAAFVETLETMPGGSIFLGYLVSGYTAAYDDLHVDDLVEPVGRPTFDEMVDRCLDGTSLASVLTSLTEGTEPFAADLRDRLEAHLRANIPVERIDVPLLVAQGEADRIIDPDAQERYVERLCRNGEIVDHHRLPGLDHVPLVEADSPLIPEVLSWTRARFGSDPAPSSCPSP